MEETKKKFELPDMVILFLLAVPDDIIQVISDISLAIPFVGEIVVFLAKLFHLFVWAGIFLWLTMKFGFGSASLVEIGGGIADFFGLPAQTISIIVAIIIVNYGEYFASAFKFAPGAEKVAAIGLALAEGDKKGAAKAAMGKSSSSLTTSNGQRVVSTPEFARSRAQSSRLVAQSAIQEAPSQQETNIPESAFGMPAEPFEVMNDESFKLAA